MHGGVEEVLHPGAQGGRPHAQRRVDLRKQPVVDAERDPAAASRRQDPLRRQRHRVRERDLDLPVDLGHVEADDLVEGRDHPLHPEIADDQRVELLRRAEQGEEPLAVDPHRERLFADDLRPDLLEGAGLQPEERPH